jgi:Amt family ammonium transporter
VASGAVAGLVVITPAAGFVTPMGALVMDLLVSPVCYWAVFLKNKLGYDDSLDAFGIHGVGGTFGALILAFFATGVADKGAQFMIQGKAVIITALYAAVMTFILIKIVGAIFGERVSRRDEELGLDMTQHGEAGYEV